MEDEDDGGGLPAEPSRRKAATTANMKMSKPDGTCMKRVSAILRKKTEARTQDDRRVLEENGELVEEYHKRRERRAVWLSRKTEQEDTKDDLQTKSEQLAQAIHDAEFLVVYTGAGISTAASIPDYRGPNGIWTLLQKGQEIGNHDLSMAEPTLTHMALSALYKDGMVRHVVSQNCDGLHLRSGLPKSAMSEVHGNMYIEVCRHCVPAREYVRNFDVTERTSTYKHTSGRRCYRCGEPLIDTIVHFGERGQLRWPLNWQGACQAANACDTILCLGSSLKVLKKYPWLWQMDRPPKKRPRLYVVNLQWTPKDKDATLKINGKCDEVMAVVMKALGYDLPHYSRISDPIFTLATPLHDAEAATTSRPNLVPPIPQPPGEETEGEGLREEQQDLDVRWDKKTDNGKEQEDEMKVKKRKLESIDDNVKEEKDLIKEECKDSVKPLNGVSTSWLPLVKDEKDHDVKTENPTEEVNHVLTPGDEIKSEHDMKNCIKEEEKVLNKYEEDNCTHFERKSNGFSIPTELSQLYTALTAEKIKPGDGYAEEDHVISAEEEEEKSESPESDEEDFQVSDIEGEAWLNDRLSEPWENNEPEDNMADKDALSSKSSDSCCSDFESEKEEDCQVEDSQAEESQVDECQTEDSQAGEYEMDDCNVSSPESGSQAPVNYLRLPYPTTSDKNDFYGTGLCIRSFIEDPKAESMNEDPVVNEAQESEHSPSMELDSTAELPEHPEADDTSLPSHSKCSTIVLSSNYKCSGEVLQSESDNRENMEVRPYDIIDQGTGDTDCINSIETSTEHCDNVESKTVNECDGNESVVENLEDTQDRITERPGAAVVSLPVDGVNTIISLGGTDKVNDVAKMDYMLHHLNQDLTQGSSQDGSFLLRTHIVDGVIRTACVETLSKDNSDKERVAIDHDKLPSSVVPSSLSELSKLSIPCLRIQRALIPAPTNFSLCKQDKLSELKLQNVVSHNNQRRNYEAKFSSQLNSSESEELKSIWYQSFCGPNNENGLGTLAAMMGVKECNLSKSLSNNINCHRPHGSNHFSSPENSSSVIMKNICAEAVSDSVAKQKGSAKKKPKGCDNEDVKYIWFWGFDSNVEQKEMEKGEDSDDSDSLPTRRVTRSRTRASCDSQHVAQVETEPEEFVCHCSGRNPELCQIRRLTSLFPSCDEDVQKARDMINRRRTYNYRRYEPIFEKQMESLTYERTKTKRKSKFDTGNNNEVDDDFDDQEQENNEMKEEEKASDGEEMRERDEKGERRTTPGWYGKGLRKGMKKKTRV
ncbi:hypothetical protein Pmani_028004 [Petrolisthes manimaculis]|uniref:protein acetyllysine N-acetyltransferase n=1 Tax=Petrolisthes manimaculis TaxID=1843537 RepID=A0AAE1TYH2_9EUCA|nr:hypothetical protein Pmani_028004 [Petrolisthes manimaculis]